MKVFIQAKNEHLNTLSVLNIIYYDARVKLELIKVLKSFVYVSHKKLSKYI